MQLALKIICGGLFCGYFWKDILKGTTSLLYTLCKWDSSSWCWVSCPLGSFLALNLIRSLICESCPVILPNPCVIHWILNKTEWEVKETLTLLFSKYMIAHIIAYLLQLATTLNVQTPYQNTYGTLKFVNSSKTLKTEFNVLYKKLIILFNLQIYYKVHQNDWYD